MLHVSSSPHITGKQGTRKIMLHVIIALMPTLIASFFIFGLYPIVSAILCVASCIVAEFCYTLITHQKHTVGDLSAVVTGLILALNLPPVLPLYVPVVGGIFAIMIVKMLFGGLGKNFANPAATARVFLLLAWTGVMTRFVSVINLENGAFELVKYFVGGEVDAATGATPLVALKEFKFGDLGLLSMFLGTHGGSAGEVSALAILIGGAYLTVMRVIDVRIPLTVIGTVALFSFIFYATPRAILPSILGGGVMLGAFFMATDYSTSPNTTAGKIVFAFGIGFLTVLFRRYGGMAEGMSFSIIVMNITVPLLDKYVRPVLFGDKNKFQKLVAHIKSKREKKKEAAVND